MLDFRSHGFAGVLEKPFEPAAVSQLLREFSGPLDVTARNAGPGLEEGLVSLLRDNILEVDFTDPGRRWE
jgi:hypothetical protein